ncbi:MAG: hypothetical protein AAF845_06700 [Bacteroidota bacterium]
MRRLLVLLCLACATSACDRPLVEGTDPSLLEVSPDLSTVRLEPDLVLSLRAPGLEGALAVSVDGVRVPFDSLAGTYELPVTLVPGLNTLRVEVTDDAGFVRVDTLRAVHLPLRRVSLVSSSASVARAAAADVALADGRILLTGGADASDRAQAGATILLPGGVQIDAREVALGEPRAAHTASVLPDGRILLLGGALTDRPTTPNEFVRTVEIVDAAGTSVTRVETDTPPARAGHTAQVLTLDGETYVTLYGGIVPAGSGTTVSGTVDVYRLGGGGLEEGETTELTRLSPEGGSGGFARVTGHTQVALNPQQATVLGRDADQNPIALSLFWSTPGTSVFPFTLLDDALPEAVGGRGRAAAVDVGAALGAPGLILVIGGETNIGRTGSMEVVVPSLGRAFRVPDVALQVPRADHTATILSTRRIVVSGGRSDTGDALTAIEAFEF